MKIYNKYQCIIQNYPREVQLSNSRRPSYFNKGVELPKKYQDVDKFDFDSKDILIDKSTGDKVIKNILSVGKPRMMTINAQRIYVGVHHSVRVKIVDALHKIFYENFKKQLPPKIDLEDKKLLFHCRFYDQYSKKLPDLDNLSNFFIKTSLDCLTTDNNKNQENTHKLGIIEDDKAQYVFAITPEFTEISEKEERMLVINLYVVSKDFNLESVLDNLMIGDYEKSGN